MKIRTRFVSNSSTSSFSIFGVETSWEEMSRVLCPEFVPIEDKMVPACKHDFDREKCKFCPECGTEAFAKKYGQKTVEWEDIDRATRELGFVFYTECDYDSVIGVELKGKGGKREALKTRLAELEKAGEKLKELFGKEADFLSGEYAC
jgi:hypothetical protein